MCTLKKITHFKDRAEKLENSISYENIKMLMILLESLVQHVAVKENGILGHFET